MDGNPTILIVDDEPDDRLLVRRLLAKGLPEATVRDAGTATALAEALAAGGVDVVITDCRLGWTSGLVVLREVRARMAECIVVMFTGTGNELVAVEAMKAGLDDYVLKSQPHAERLPATVRRLLEQRDERRRTVAEHAATEAHYRALVEQIPAITYTAALDSSSSTTSVSPQVESILGYTTQEWLGDAELWMGRLHPEDRDRVMQEVYRSQASGEPFRAEYRLLAKDGSVRWIADDARVVRDEAGTPLCLQGVMLDVSERKRTEEALRDSEAHLRALFAAMTAVLVIDRDGRHVEVAPTAAGLLVRPRNELKGKLQHEVLPKDMADWGLGVVRRVLDRGAAETVEYRLEVAGREVWFEGAISPLAEDRVVWVARDITGRKRAEEELGFRLGLEQLVSGISSAFISTPVEMIDAGITDALRRIAEFVGALRSSVFVISDDLATATNTHEWCADPSDSQIALLQGIPFETFGYYRSLLNRLENVVVSRLVDLPTELARGEREWSKIHGFRPLLFTPMVLEGGLFGAVGFYGAIGEEREWPRGFVDLLRFVGDIFVNALRRKHADEKIKSLLASAQHERDTLQALVDSVSDEVWFTDPQGRITLANPTARQAFHLTGAVSIAVQELAANLEVRRPDGSPRPIEEAPPLLALAGEAVRNQEEIVRTPGSGDLRHREVSSTPVRDASGSVIGAVSVVRDITERKRADQALRDSERRYRDLVDTMTEGLGILDADGAVAFMNRRACAMLGYELGELVGRPGASLFDEENRGVLRRRLAERRQGKREPYEITWTRKDGGKVPSLLSPCPLFDETGRYQGTLGVITDITSLKTAERALRVSEQRYRLFFEHSLDGILLTAPDGRVLAANSAACRMFGRSEEEIRRLGRAGIIDTGDPRLPAALEQRRLTGRFAGELTGLRADGSPFPIEISTALFTDESGEPRTAMVARDITERKRLEQEREGLLAEVQGLAARLADAEQEERRRIAGVLHDRVGQGLTALGLNLSFLKGQLSPEAAAQVGDRIDDSVQLLAETVAQVRDVMTELHPPELEDYGVLATLRRLAGQFAERSAVGVEVAGAEPEPRLSLSAAAALVSIAQEALTNVAKHARARQVTITLEVDAERVRLAISDDGIGFAVDGSGVAPGAGGHGLRRMKERALAVGGTFDARSRPGGGAAVVVEIAR